MRATRPYLQQVETAMTPVLILSSAICVTMFALGFGLLLPITSAFSGFADLVGVAAGMVVLGLLVG